MPASIVTLRLMRQLSWTNHSTLLNCELASGWPVASEYELTDPRMALAYGWLASSGLAVLRAKLNAPLNTVDRAAGRVVYSMNTPALRLCVPTILVMFIDVF